MPLATATPTSPSADDPREWIVHVVTLASAAAAAELGPAVATAPVLEHHDAFRRGTGDELVSLRIVADTHEHAAATAVRRWFYLADELRLRTASVQFVVESSP